MNDVKLHLLQRTLPRTYNFHHLCPGLQVQHAAVPERSGEPTEGGHPGHPGHPG